MSKSLKTVQTLAKVGKIIAKILSIFCIIGAVGASVGFVALLGVQALTPDNSSGFGGIFRSVLDLSLDYAILGCIFAVISCVGEFILCRYAVKYFDNELAAGTPFTHEGAKEILRLGILAIAIPMAISIAEGIVFGIFLLFSANISDVDMGGSTSIGTGIMLIVASFVFKYGADLTEEKRVLQEGAKQTENAQEEQEEAAQ